MTHGQGAWRASTVVVPSGSDTALITRVLAAGDASLRVVSMSGYGSVGSAKFSVWMIPPGQGTAAIYSVTASEPIYCMAQSIPINGSTQTDPAVWVPGLYTSVTASAGSWTIPPGWSMGVMPSVTSSGDGTFSAVAVKTQL